MWAIQVTSASTTLLGTSNRSRPTRSNFGTNYNYCPFGKSSQAEADAAVRGVTISTSADANTVQMTTTPTARIYKISSAITHITKSPPARRSKLARFAAKMIGSAHDKQAMPFKVPTFLRRIDAKTTGSYCAVSVELVARTDVAPSGDYSPSELNLECGDGTS